METGYKLIWERTTGAHVKSKIARTKLEYCVFGLLCAPCSTKGCPVSIRLRSQGVSAVQCGQGSSSDADVRNFGAKNFEFFENYGVSLRTRKMGGGVNFFAILCGRLLGTVRNQGAVTVQYSFSLS